MAETKTSGSWNLDGLAAKLQAKAEQVLQSHGSTGSKDADGEAATTVGKREALKNVANIVKETAGKGLDSSKEYLTQVVEKVSTYATEASTTATAHFADVKEKGVTHLNSASDSANVHYAAVKEKAATHITGLQTSLNRAIAQGQAQGEAKKVQVPASSTPDSEETTDRALPAEPEEQLTFPFNVIAWFVALCHGRGISTTATTTGSTTSTSKDYSVESLQNAAATLTETLAEGVQGADVQAKSAEDKSVSGSAEVKTTT